MTMEWLRHAACAGQDPELWFPLDESLERLTAPARAVCAGCPVADECLAYALEAGLDAGIYGGLTADERRELRAAERRRTRAA